MLDSIRSLVPKEGRILLILLALVASSWIFVLLAGRVVGGKTQAFDEELLIAMRRPSDLSIPIGPQWVESLAIELTALGGAFVLFTFVGIVAGYLALVRRFGMMWLVIAATVGGGVISSLLKDVVERGRPSVVPHLAHVRSGSFPSGHSMLSAVVYLTLGALLARNTANWNLRLYFLGVATLLTFLIGVTRIYLGVHYPTDVLSGWCAGLTWALLCELAAQRLQRRGVVPQPGP
jgi:undecaprenyl-diphosphatase